MNTLCGRPVLEHKYSDDAENAHIEQNVVLKSHQVGEYVTLIHAYHQNLRRKALVLV